MNRKNSEEEDRIERAEEEKALEATVDHERLARLVLEANYSPVRSAAPYSPPQSASAPAAKKSSAWMIVIVLAVVILLGASFFMLTFDASRKGGSAPPVNRPTNDNYKNGPKITAMMVAIPGGIFVMGRNDGPLQESPLHAVKVGNFFMDNTEVTNGEYGDFIRETHHPPPEYWNGTKPPYGTEQWPVVNVSLADAQIFAAWRSKRDGMPYRLPTEEEWEYAARNGTNDLYPWGYYWAKDLAVVNMTSPQAVGSMPKGANQWGVFDLIGNVWEWTSSKGSVYPGNPTVLPSQFKEWCVIRGGSYASDGLSKERPITATFRDWLAPSAKAPQLGFRLVRAGP
jgi:iron(II)-dependent oxidoreductase